MAGSFNHVIDTDTGMLLGNQGVVSMLENGGDVYEAVEEMYGMIWYLAEKLAEETHGAGNSRALRPFWEEMDSHQKLALRRGLVEEARQNYQIGIEHSPGVGGDLDDEDED